MTAETEKAEKQRRKPSKRRKSIASKTETLPVLPLQGVVLFPYAICSLALDSKEQIKLLDSAMKGKRLVALMPQKDSEEAPTTTEDLHPVGCLGRIVKTLRLPDDTRRILVRGLQRVTVEEIDATGDFITGQVHRIDVPEDDSLETDALAKTAQGIFQGLIGMSPSFPDELRIVVYNIDDYGRLADMIADTINLSIEEKLSVLGTIAIQPRLQLVISFLQREELMFRVGSEIQSKVGSEMAKSQREHFLREQLRAIQEQLGEDAETPDVTELREKVETAELPEEAREAALSEVKRLRQMHPAAADYNVSRTYVEWILSLPWNKFSRDCLDIAAAEKILEQDHYDLTKVKERILEFLAVLQLKQDMKAPILCFVGPPGVGKTSLGQSIARALGRKFVRFSLGGVRDEAEIRGHRRTYVGALPGRIVQGLKRAKTANPVFMLDEIDKLGADFRGDPASALLEVLDPQQNTSFSDHYIDVAFDLSNVLFITTANLVDPIPPALKDRMEIIRIPGYTQNEKCEIARKFLVPRQLKENGLKRSQVSFYKKALETIIGQYTSEAGVRNLEREIAHVCRKHARAIVEEKAKPDRRQTITTENIKDYLGPQRLFPETTTSRRQVGVTTALAWTAAGGEILFIEANTVPGKGELVLTGSLGNVMKESAQIAFSLVRSMHKQLGFKPEMLENADIHVHVPSGATPKDGPSAGIAIAVAIGSLLTGRNVTPRVAMTGEISLQGHVLPVGGIKEKILAASRAGVKTVLLPAKNQNELLEDIPPEIQKKMTFKYLESASNAFKLALD
jgi:ATP-dependent Lon protease